MTAVIELLDRFVPVLSLGVLYVFAVLPIAVVWGLAYSVCVSVACMLAFNFFFLPPLYTLTLADSRNWFALLVFVVTSIVVSELAARSRRRAREASLLAEIATSLLEHGTVGARAGADLGRGGAGAPRRERRDQPRRRAGPGLRADRRRAAGRDDHACAAASEGEGARRRLLPALASLLGVAIDRERLEQEAVEAEALRRADAIKTALLRSVSHDLRTPLMAISTSAGALARPDLAIDAADRAELLATILAASNRLDQLVSNLLDLSRLQAGAADPRRELIEVDDLVVAALDELGAAAGRVEVSLPEEPPAVEVDAQQVQRALVNLIENALKYSPSDEPVRVQAAATPSRGGDPGRRPRPRHPAGRP